MTEKQIHEPKKCKACGTVTYRGYSKYTCNGCGKSIGKGNGPLGRDMIDVNIAFKSDSPYSSHTLHFHNLDCVETWFAKTDKKTIDNIQYIHYWCHSSEDVQTFIKLLRGDDYL